MYTLRLFKDKKEIERTQIYLGDSYIVKGASKEDKKLGINYVFMVIGILIQKKDWQSMKMIMLL